MTFSATSPPDPSLDTEPAVLVRADRRHSRRRRLRRPTEVALHGTGPTASWRRLGTLLNLSQDGLACRLHEGDVAGLVCGQTLRVVFCLEGVVPSFDLPGQVSNITEGGTADHKVVGVAFLSDGRQEELRERLRHTLDNDRVESRSHTAGSG